VSATMSPDLLVIRSSFRFAITSVVPFVSALFCVWITGWFAQASLSPWPAIVSVAAGALLVRFNVSNVASIVAYPFTVINTLASRSIAAGFVTFLALWLDGVRGTQLQAPVSFALNMWLITSVLSTALISLSLHKRFRRPSLKIAAIGVTEASIAFAHKLANQPYLALDFVGYVEDRGPERIPDHSPFPILCRIDGVKNYLSTNVVHHMVVSLPTTATYRFQNALDQLLDSTCSVHYLHDFLLFKPIRERLTTLGNIAVFTVIDSPTSGWESILKRMFDVVASAAALVILSPLLIVTAAWIKHDSRGPVLFKQSRWGTGAEPFQIFKFRSMTQSASAASSTAQATKNDSRITKVGAFIRRTSIDELPQLINILCGDMSLVGPRPHAVAHNQEYRGLVKGYMLRHKIKPGLTGWAQVHGFRGETDTIDKMEGRIGYDLEYLRNWTLSLDLYIIVRTVALVLRRTNAW
jgi:putative colanic acid biosysnthesis UDP-glucose lipid carrier transferase